MKFQKGEKVNVLAGKYKGQNVHIFDVHINFNPIGYSCKTNNGKELFLYETEIQSIYQHDIAVLNLKQ